MFGEGRVERPEPFTPEAEPVPTVEEQIDPLLDAAVYLLQPPRCHKNEEPQSDCCSPVTLVDQYDTGNS